MSEQGHEGDRIPPAPQRPSVTVGPTPTEASARPRPRAIHVSYALWIAACLVGVSAAAVTLPYFGQLEAELLAMVQRQFPQEVPATQEKVATAAVATLIGTGVVIVLTQLAFAVAVFTGRGWARFVLVLLAAFSLIFTVSVLTGAPEPTQLGLLVTLVMVVAATVLMFLPGNRDWFAQQRLLRSGGYPYDD